MNMNVNFEDELLEVIRNACPEGKEEKFKEAAKRYWKDTTINQLIDEAFEE